MTHQADRRPRLLRPRTSLAAVAVVVAAACSSGAATAPVADAAPPQAAPVGPPRAATQADPAAFDRDLAWRHLERIVGFGPRPSGSQALKDTRAYIISTMKSYGLTVEEQRFTPVTPNGRIEMVNLIVRIAGRRTDRILLAGHYDTKLMKNVSFVGASDGGSSAAFLIEAARALSRRPGEFTYELVWFDGEEAVCTDWNECGTASAPDNTYGSRYYVARATDTKTLASIRALILVDMIGDKDLQLRRDSLSTPWLTDIVWSTAKQLAAGHVFLDTPTPVEDDHVPFLRAGVPAVDIIDLVDYPYWHTADDTLDKVSAASLKVVGDVVLASIPRIEERLAADPRR